MELSMKQRGADVVFQQDGEDIAFIRDVTLTLDDVRTPEDVERFLSRNADKLERVRR